jgi:hypothetical protein
VEWKEVGHQLSGEGVLGSPFTRILTPNLVRTVSTASCAISKSRLKTSNGVYLKVEEGQSTVSTYCRLRDCSF